MPNDAKLGLVCGVGLVLAVGVVFFRKGAPTRASAQPAAIVKPLPAPPTDGGRGSRAAVEAPIHAASLRPDEGR